MRLRARAPRLSWEVVACRQLPPLLEEAACCQLALLLEEATCRHLAPLAPHRPAGDKGALVGPGRRAFTITGSGRYRLQRPAKQPAARQAPLLRLPTGPKAATPEGMADLAS